MLKFVAASISSCEAVSGRFRSAGFTIMETSAPDAIVPVAIRPAQKLKKRNPETLAHVFHHHWSRIGKRLSVAWLLIVLLSLAWHVQAAGDASAGKDQAVACAACHGQDGATGLDGTYPNLAGQNEKYLVSQLKMIQSGDRPILSSTDG